MKFVADGNIAALDETFARHGELTRLEGRLISRADLANSDALLVRSITPVGPDLLEGTPVRFVGTATIGTDHLDTQWLDDQGIAWAAAPGCNADAAAQYTLGMMALACRRLNRDLFSQSVGIVGRGNVGARLQKLLHALKIPCVACDPPLADAGQTGLVELPEALRQPFVSLHVPLTHSGAYPTSNMIGQEQLDKIPQGGLLINAARGGVIEANALLAGLREKRLYAALDVWPGEPDISPALIEAATVATPHVAGYSQEGRTRGTEMIYQAFCAWAGITRPHGLAVPAPQVLDNSAGEGLLDILVSAAQVEADDQNMRYLLDSPTLAAEFDGLRKHYSMRRDYSGLAARGDGGDGGGDTELLKKLGFSSG